jgi:hypothetical protein
MKSVHLGEESMIMNEKFDITKVDFFASKCLRLCLVEATLNNRDFKALFLISSP